MSGYVRVLSMKKALATIFVSLVFATLAQGQMPASYVGYEYKGVVPDTKLPNGVKHQGGGLISDHNIDPVYGISQVSKGKTRMLWLEVSTGQNEKGITGWRVLDVISLPALTRSQHILFPPDPAVECLRNGKAVPHLVALGRVDRRRGIFLQQRVWTADLMKMKFQPASIRGLRCTYSEP